MDITDYDQISVELLGAGKGVHTYDPRPFMRSSAIQLFSVCAGRWICGSLNPRVLFSVAPKDKGIPR